MIWNQAVETMAREDLQALQLSRLRRVVAEAAARVPFYQRRLREAGVKAADIRRLADLQRLPFTVKSDLRDHYPLGLLAVPREKVVRIHGSSGTRGKPTLVAYTRQDLLAWAESCARALACAGAEPGQILHNAYGYGLFTGGLGLHQGGERLGLTVIPVSGGNTARQVQLLVDLGAHGLACTPSYALNLADALAEAEVPVAALKLRWAILGAEPWTDAMRHAIESRLGVHAVDIYGLSEIVGPGVACECWQAKDGLHVNEDLFLPEVVDPKTGEPLPEGEVGELVLTTLAKEAMPMLRYRTGDLCSLRSGTCACGRTLVRMSRVKGRQDDMLIIRGVNVFPSEVERVLLGIDGLAPHYQLVIDRVGNLDQLAVEVEMQPGHALARGQRKAAQEALGAAADGGAAVTPAGASTDDLQRLVQVRLQEALGLRVEARLLPPGAVPRSEGKAKRVVDRRPGLAL